jgi:hypothetical protein
MTIFAFQHPRREAREFKREINVTGRKQDGRVGDGGRKNGFLTQHKSGSRGSDKAPMRREVAMNTWASEELPEFF